MSASFRPVIESWGLPSSCFIASKDLADLLEDLAGSNSLTSHQEPYGEFISVCIHEGRQFLELIGQSSLKERLSPWTDDLDSSDLDSLLSNLQAQAKDWSQQLDPVDGSLTFYIDAF